MSTKFRTDAKIRWYRCKVDPRAMSELMKTSDWPGYRQSLGHLGLWFATGALCWLAFSRVTAANWYWAVPLLYACLFAHGTVGSFMGGLACHELSHKTPFKTKPVNEFFLKVFAFFSWFDPIFYRQSHIKHHQVTTHHDYDGEVVLPQKFTFSDWQFWLALFAWNPVGTWKLLSRLWQRARGHLDNDWYEFVLPENNGRLRREEKNWSRFLLIGHALLATAFIVTGHWFLIVIFNLGTQYCGWLGFLCGAPQHFGLQPDVPDHRLCCRTYTCSWLPGFLYWNMQYHVEHHMFPAVPFYNLPKLRKLIEHDLPPAPHGLRATWKIMMEIHRKQQADPTYVYVPELGHSGGDSASDEVLQREAALAL